MKILIFCLLFLLSVSAHSSATTHPDLRSFPTLLNADIYAGFGLARDMINHVYKDQPFKPRDYDLAVVGSDLSEKEATKVLAQHGTIVKTLQMYREEIKPSGNVFAYHYGFVIIIESEGTQIDFKFFNTVDDAHTRGLFDVEKVLIPLANRTLTQVVKDLTDHKNVGKPFEYSDPHGGFESILAKTPTTVNWAKAQASSLDWIIRGAMINAKIGAVGFNPVERQLMIERLGQIQYIKTSDVALLKRAVAHKNSEKVRAFLQDLGFFKFLKTWRWNSPALDIVKSWRPKAFTALSCKKII